MAAREQFRLKDSTEPAPHRALVAGWVQHEIEQTDRKASVIDEIAGATGLVLLLIGAFLALHLA